MFFGGVVVADLVVERAEREINKRRRALHIFENPFAARNHFLNFKSIPAAFVIAQNIVCQQVIFKNFTGSVMRRRGQSFPDKKRENSKEKYHKKRETGNIKHHRNDPEGNGILRFLFY